MAVAIAAIARCESRWDVLHGVDSHFLRDVANLLERSKTDSMVGLSASLAMDRFRLLTSHDLCITILGSSALEARLRDERSVARESLAGWTSRHREEWSRLVEDTDLPDDGLQGFGNCMANRNRGRLSNRRSPRAFGRTTSPMDFLRRPRFSPCSIT